MWAERSVFAQLFQRKYSEVPGWRPYAGYCPINTNWQMCKAHCSA